MKKFRFRLEKVQRVRRIQEELARAELQAANRAVAEAERVKMERFDRYQARDDLFGESSLDGFMTARTLKEAAAYSVLDGVAKTEETRGVALERRDDWIGARSRVDALERLESRRRDEHSAEWIREQQELVDEIVVTRHGHRIRRRRDEPRRDGTDTGVSP